MADDLEVVEGQLAEYVGFKRRRGHDDYRLADALIEHRRQALENLLLEENDIWTERVRLLDRLAAQKNISLADERPLRYALDEIAERERKRRAEFIEARKGDAV